VAIAPDGKLAPLLPPGDWNERSPVAADRGRMFFASDRSGAQQILVFDANTREAHPLDGAAGEDSASASHDGRLVAYSAERGIWVRALDGSGVPRHLTDDAGDAQPKFTRNDREIVFERGPGSDVRLWIVAIDGGAARRLVETPSQLPMPSAADDRIFFVERLPTGKRIMMTTSAGAKPVAARLPQFAAAAGNTWSFVRSRDGQRIAAVRGGYEVLEARLDGSEPPVVKHRLRRWIESLTYAGDDHQIIAAADFAEGDLWLAEGRFP
jgi:hypothetical protein